MEWKNTQFDRTGRPVNLDSLNDLATISRAPSPHDLGGVTVVEDLVNQAVEMFQSIEDRAAETNARAYDLARRATEQLKLAERRTHALESALSAAEASLSQAKVRIAETEQVAMAA